MKSCKVWLFDLDNTLHDAAAHIYPHISRAMTRYLQHHLDMEESAANALRLGYWRRYGATLPGLIKHHGTDPAHFLWHTHQFASLAELLRWERGLMTALKRLPGRKIIFSNAPAHYVEQVLRLLKIEKLFEQVFSIDRVGYSPKPQACAFHRLLRRSRLDARCCIMVEDQLENLKAAKKLGMRTVWVNPVPRRTGIVDLCVRSVLDLPGVAYKLHAR
ncbi:MAG: pyrimidine 5'-nucleotidase [Burkholderiales bacterium]